jgi:hypothetical protein
MHMHRRHILAALGLSPLWITPARAGAVKEITWDDLMPSGVPYSEIIGEGATDEKNDTWLPAFDENGSKFVDAFDGQKIKMPGYILPIETGGTGITEFILTPYVGACIHVPPPPPNQLVYVTSKTPWPSETMWDAIWVTGTLRINPIDTNLAVIGYEMDADLIELYEWM